MAEDSALIAQGIEALLRSTGVEVVGPAPDLHSVVQLAEQEPLDAAVLDVDLRGETVFAAAEALRRRCVPFLFLTGYSDSPDFPEAFEAERRLSKPMSADALLGALTALVSQTGTELPRPEDRMVG